MSGTIWERTLGLVGSALRSDSWENFWTGFGTRRDKTQGGAFNPNARLTDVELTHLYHHDDIAGRIVDLVPREMLRQGFGITCKDPEAAQVVAAKIKTLDTVNHVKRAAIWGRLFGGALVMLGADDGQDARLPLDESRIRSFTFLQVYDRRRAQPDTWYEAATDRKFGQPQVYRLTNYRTGGVSYVHESRLIRFGGAITGDYEQWQNVGWDYSVLQKPYEAIRAFQSVYRAAEIMMADASQGVFKMRGLLSMIAAGKLKDLQTRALFLDECRSVARAVFLDAEGGESFDKVQTTFAGVAEMLDREANRLAAATEIPVTKLMGQAPAGLNATGANDVRGWYDTVQADRKTELEPRLERIVRLVSIAERVGDRQFGVSFLPLWQETPKERADRLKVEADTAKVWIDGEVLSPEEVAIAQFSGPEPQPYRIDPKTRIQNQTLGPNDVPGATRPTPNQGPGIQGQGQDSRYIQGHGETPSP
jgi:phage-related protein (TIGR01555 family)